MRTVNSSDSSASDLRSVSCEREAWHLSTFAQSHKWPNIIIQRRVTIAILLKECSSELRQSSRIALMACPHLLLKTATLYLETGDFVARNGNFVARNGNCDFASWNRQLCCRKLPFLATKLPVLVYKVDYFQIQSCRFRQQVWTGLNKLAGGVLYWELGNASVGVQSQTIKTSSVVGHQSFCVKTTQSTVA